MPVDKARVDDITHRASLQTKELTRRSRQIKDRRTEWVELDPNLTLAEQHDFLRSGGKVPDTCLARFILRPAFEKFGGCVVLLNFLIMTLETQASATEDEAMKDFVIIANRILLVYYTVEMCLHFYVMRRHFFSIPWNILDLLIVITGLISEVFLLLEAGGSGMDQFAMLKSLRMLRLLRLVRLLVAFRELYVLVAGIGRCMRTLFWAAGLIFVVLNVWAILSVEFLDARVKELVSKDAFGACGWCATAFSNVWYANLTWFQIISTADWATIGRPLAEEFGWPYLIFVCNIFVVMWGLLNLIVAAIVDANIAAREDDYAIAAKLAAQSRQEAWSSFADICKAMDADGSGEISVDEFKEFLRDSVELQQHLQIMGVQEKDVDDLLELMDEDGSGALEQSEFIEQFTKMRTLVEKTTLFFLHKFMQSLAAKISQQTRVVQRMGKEMADMRTLNTFGFCGRNSERSEEEPIAAQASYLSAHSTDTAAISASAKRASVSKEASLPDVDVKALPLGWYYFGSSLPLEAGAWCRTIDPLGVVAASNRVQFDDSKRASNVVIQEGPVITHGVRWEPVPSSGVSARRDPSTLIVSSQVSEGITCSAQDVDSYHGAEKSPSQQRRQSSPLSVALSHSSTANDEFQEAPEKTHASLGAQKLELFSSHDFPQQPTLLRM